jgi:predicted dehydrogenase/nucleoside-diphosphate-sugar epimerase
MHEFEIAIIGCGAATKRYYVPILKHYKALLSKICLVDLDLSQAASLKKELGDGSIFCDYKDLLGRVAGAIVVLPPFMHYRVAKDFLASGAHVLCEKPLAAFSHEVADLEECAKVNNVTLSVNNTRRMFPNLSAIRDLLRNGAVGKLRSISYQEGNTFAWPSNTGFYVDPSVSSKGVVLDIGPHALDTICWWLDDKPVIDRCQDDSFGGPESVARIEGSCKECQISIFLNRLNDIPCEFEITGSKGSIKGDVFNWSHFQLTNRSGKVETRKIPNSIKNYPGFVEPVLKNFVEVVKGNANPLIRGNDVIDSIALIEAYYQKRRRFDLPWYDLPEKRIVETSCKVLVTGATGFIGGRIVERLFLSGLEDVRAAVHNLANAARLGRFSVHFVQLDLVDPESIKDALEGATHVIHCAKGAGDVTVEGTHNLLQCALDAKVRRFVHLSTTEVYGDVSGLISENFPYQYTGNEYNRTKIDAEKVCWKFHEQGLPLTVVRPSIVYGPFSKNWTVHVARMLAERKLGIYESFGEGKCNLVYIDDLVDAILLALENEDAVGQAFNIVGPDLLSWNEYFVQMNLALSFPEIKRFAKHSAGLKPLAMQPLRLIGGIVRDHFMTPIKKIAETISLADMSLRKIEHLLKTTPATADMKLFKKNAVFCSRKAESVLKFTPVVNSRNGIIESAKWLRHHGIL